MGDDVAMKICSKQTRVKNGTERRTQVCDKPVHKDGLCRRHWNRLQEKQTNWIDRKNYRPATLTDLVEGRSLKLKDTNAHRLFVVRGDVVKEYDKKTDSYNVTNIAPDYNLFCVKDEYHDYTTK